MGRCRAALRGSLSSVSNHPHRYRYVLRANMDWTLWRHSMRPTVRSDAWSSGGVLAHAAFARAVAVAVFIVAIAPFLIGCFGPRTLSLRLGNTDKTATILRIIAWPCEDVLMTMNPAGQATAWNVQTRSPFAKATMLSDQAIELESTGSSIDGAPTDFIVPTIGSKRTLYHWVPGLAMQALPYQGPPHSSLIAVGPQAKYYAMQGMGELHICERHLQHPLAVVTDLGTRIIAARFSVDDRQLAAFTSSGDLLVIDTASGSVILKQELSGHHTLPPLPGGRMGRA